MAGAILLISIAIAGLQLQTRDSPANRTTAKSAGVREDVSTFAGNMLNETNQARTAIKNGNLELAKDHVNRAEADLQKVEAQAQGRTMIPVYQEFVSVSILAPVQTEQNARRAKAQSLSAAKSSRTGGDKAVAHEVSGIYTSVYVNTTVAKNSLAAAKAALSQGNLLTADSALADVQEGVKIQSDKSDMPLEQARENLILARASARNGDYQGAGAALKAASEALSTYANEGGPHANEAMAMAEEIDACRQKLPRNHADVIARINKWWNTTADWSPYRQSAAVLEREPEGIAEIYFGTELSDT
jgi:YfdX protein